MLTSSGTVQPVQVDMTYNCGDKVLLTAVNIQDPRFERTHSPGFAKREPIIPVHFMISNGRRQDDYKYLAKKLAKASQLKDTDCHAIWVTKEPSYQMQAASESKRGSSA